METVTPDYCILFILYWQNEITVALKDIRQARRRINFSHDPRFGISYLLNFTCFNKMQVL